MSLDKEVRDQFKSMQKYKVEARCWLEDILGDLLFELHEQSHLDSDMEQPSKLQVNSREQVTKFDEMSPAKISQIKKFADKCLRSIYKSSKSLPANLSKFLSKIFQDNVQLELTYLTNFEKTKVQKTVSNTLKNVTEEVRAMLFVFFMITRVLIAEVLLSPKKDTIESSGSE